MATEQDHVWAMLDDMQVFLAKRHVPTPERTYKLDGGWTLAMDDLRNFIDRLIAERDALKQQLAAAVERAESGYASAGKWRDLYDKTAGQLAEATTRAEAAEAAGKAVEALKAAQVPILRKICADDDSVARPCGIGTDRQWMRLEDALARTPSQHRKEIEAGALREAKDSLKELIQAGAGALTVGRNAGIADAIIHLAKMEKEADRLAKEAGNG